MIRIRSIPMGMYKLHRIVIVRSNQDEISADKKDDANTPPIIVLKNTLIRAMKAKRKE